MASRDYEEFIAALNSRKVRYLVVGAHAVAFHVRPRATRDLDIWLEPTQANAKKVLAALAGAHRRDGLCHIQPTDGMPSPQ
jgi:hypothetical protein